MVIVVYDFKNTGRTTEMPRKKPWLAIRFSEWFDPLMQELIDRDPRMNATLLAKKLDLLPDQVSKMRNGQRMPQPGEIPIIERFVGQMWPERALRGLESPRGPLSGVPLSGVTVAKPALLADLRERRPSSVVRGTTSTHGVATASVRPIEVLYAAETQVFRPRATGRKQLMTAVAELVGPPCQDYPQDAVFAVEVRDNSMDADRPIQLNKGTYALCVDFIAAKLTLTTGLSYLIRRSMDDGNTFEYLIRRASVYTDRIDWAPMSTDPSFEVLSVGLAMAAVEVLGVVYATVATRSLTPGL